MNGNDTAPRSVATLQVDEYGSVSGRDVAEVVIAMHDLAPVPSGHIRVVVLRSNIRLEMWRQFVQHVQKSLGPNIVVMLLDDNDRVVFMVEARRSWWHRLMFWRKG